MHLDFHKSCDSDQLFQELAAAGVPVLAVYEMGAPRSLITSPSLQSHGPQACRLPAEQQLTRTGLLTMP